MQLETEGCDRVGHAHCRLEPVGRHPLERGHAHGPECRLVARRELAGLARDFLLRVEKGTARHRQPRRQLPLFAIERDLDQCHRRNRAHVVRIHDLEECLADLGHVLVDALVHARREERERLEHTLDVRVIALDRLEIQIEAFRDFGVFTSEPRAHAAQKGQLPLVVLEQLIIRHRRPPPALSWRRAHPGACRT